MRFLRRKPKLATDLEIDEALRWNRWVEGMRDAWQVAELLPAHHPSRRRLHELNDAMWQLDPDMFNAVTACLPPKWRSRQLWQKKG